jgi:hypothetical protein
MLWLRLEGSHGLCYFAGMVARLKKALMFSCWQECSDSVYLMHWEVGL